MHEGNFRKPVYLPHRMPYEIVSAIDAGGMGEVCRARDSELRRDVAIKVLPDGFARDADRMARFEHEAKVLASLNHPNVATIHALEDSGGTRALVMELVEGPTLIKIPPPKRFLSLRTTFAASSMAGISVRQSVLHVARKWAYTLANTG